MRRIFLIAVLGAMLEPSLSFTPAPLSTRRKKERICPSRPRFDSLTRTNLISSTFALSATRVLETDERIKLLDAALNNDSGSADTLLSEMSELRKAGEGDEVEKILNDILSSVEATSALPRWTRFRPVARFSRRARRQSLRRVLQLSTPFDEIGGTDTDAHSRLRRRTLFFLLGNVKSTLEKEGKKSKLRRLPAVLSAEIDAIRDTKSDTQAKDMDARLPDGLETPEYEVLKSDKGGYEIRLYEPFSVCSVAMNKRRPEDPSKTDAQLANPQISGASSFGALAGYLFGKNEESLAMKMTTPVFKRGEGDSSKMSFVLPSQYWNETGIDTAPNPIEGSGVEITRENGGHRAVVMFGGFAGKKDVEARTEQLLRDVQKDKEWNVDSDSSVDLAQYNDPFTPPWKRRNEVSVLVSCNEPNK